MDPLLSLLGSFLLTKVVFMLLDIGKVVVHLGHEVASSEKDPDVVSLAESSIMNLLFEQLVCTDCGRIQLSLGSLQP